MDLTLDQYLYLSKTLYELFNSGSDCISAVSDPWPFSEKLLKCTLIKQHLDRSRGLSTNLIVAYRSGSENDEHLIDFTYKYSANQNFEKTLISMTTYVSGELVSSDYIFEISFNANSRKIDSYISRDLLREISGVETEYDLEILINFCNTIMNENLDVILERIMTHNRKELDKVLNDEKERYLNGKDLIPMFEQGNNNIAQILDCYRMMCAERELLNMIEDD